MSPLPSIPAWVRVLLACAAAMALVPRGAGAQPAEAVSVHVNLMAKSVYVGDAAEVQVIVRHGQDVGVPEAASSADFTLTYAGAYQFVNESIDFSGGRQRRVREVAQTHKFSLVPNRAGPMTLAPMRVVVDGKTYLTEEVRFTAVEPAQTADYRLRLTVEKLRVYVGEPVRLRLTWLLGREVKGFGLALPPLPGSVELLAAPDPRTGGAGVGAAQQFVQVQLGSEPTVGRVGSEVADGRTFDTVTLEKVLIARSPGVVHVGAARADFYAVTGKREPRFMDSPFDDLRITERQTASSVPFDLEVLPLPAPGRPADFSGLVGAYSVTASAEPREASVGEPITLRVTVNGPPPLSLIPPLDLAAQPALSPAFRVPRDPGLPTYTPVGAMFSAAIRARSADLKQVPPVALNYFDPASGQYRVARSEPIAIVIHPSASAAGSDDGPEDESPAVGKSASSVDLTPVSFSRRGTVLERSLTDPLVLAELLLPPFGVGAIAAGAAVLRRHRADPDRLRRRRALRVAVRRLRRAGSVRDPLDAASLASGVLTGLAADWFGRPAGSLTSREAARLLASAADPAAVEISQLLARCDQVRFAPAKQGGAAPGDEPADGLLTRAGAALAQLAAMQRARA